MHLKKLKLESQLDRLQMKCRRIMEELSGQRILMYLKFLRYFLSYFDDDLKTPVKEQNCFSNEFTNFLQDENPSMKSVTEHSNAGRKRTGVPDTIDGNEDDTPGKRAKSTPGNLEGPGCEINKGQDKAPFSGTTPSSDVDSGPVQQLVAMFAVLVAQGEKAAASLEILISSISADLLAEVVMANIRNLPAKRPKSEGDEEQLICMAAHPEMIGKDSHIKHLSLLLKDILLQSTSSQEKETGTENPHHVVSSELEACIIFLFNLTF